MDDGIGCVGCKNADAAKFELPFTMAFQPIIDLSKGKIWGYEALVRGVNGEGAGQVLAQVNDQNIYAFDQACRIKAIELAGALLPQSSDAMLSINFMPNAVYQTKACIRATLAAASKVRFSPRRLMFEFTESERMKDICHVAHIVEEYKKMGFTTALDDFGAGYAGLSRLAQFQTDIIKLDMKLVRDIDQSETCQTIVRYVAAMAKMLNIKVLAEGVETEAETHTLLNLGIHLFQGYFFAKPQFKTFIEEKDIDPIVNGFPVPASAFVQVA